MSKRDRYQDYEDYGEYRRESEPGRRRSGRDEYGDDRYEGSRRSRSHYEDDRYADDRYEDDRYADDRYEDDRYEDDRYADDRYEDDRYEDDRYADDRYEDDRYVDDRYEDDRYQDLRGRRSGGRKKEQRKKKTGGKKTGKIILFIVEILVLAIVLGVLYVSTKVEKIGKVSLNEEKITMKVSEEVKQEVETGTMKGYRNIVLFGVDSRSDNLASGDNRSDTIIIASINQDTGEIKLCSVYRDTYLNLGNDSYNKCNAAYAKGGPEQAINMLNTNLDMYITDFVTIGFRGLVDVIDDVGGVDVDVTEDEIVHLNNYQLSMTDELGYPVTEVTSAGTQHLNGLQATAYCRIRYTTGDDFRRAERQRSVLMKVLEKAKQSDVATLNKIAGDIFSEIYTSLDLSEITEMIGDISMYTVTEQDGFPHEDMRATGTVGAKGSCVIPRDLSGNVKWLHEFLFDDTDYEVSDQVQEYSSHIAADTAGVG